MLPEHLPVCPELLQLLHDGALPPAQHHLALLEEVGALPLRAVLVVVLQGPVAVESKK